MKGVQGPLSPLSPLAGSRYTGLYRFQRGTRCKYIQCSSRIFLCKTVAWHLHSLIRSALVLCLNPAPQGLPIGKPASAFISVFPAPRLKVPGIHVPAELGVRGLSDSSPHPSSFSRLLAPAGWAAPRPSRDLLSFYCRRRMGTTGLPSLLSHPRFNLQDREL